MSHPWWKVAPTPAPVAQPAPSLGNKPMPWAEEASKAFGGTRLRCSAEGCVFEGTDFVTAAYGPGVRPYCQHHATGGELVVRDMLWRMPCACGKVADGYHRSVGGFTAMHTERKCLQRTVRAAPEDLTVPRGLPMPSPSLSASALNDRARATGEPRCACGKRVDGTVNTAGGFTEWHAARECIEQTLKETAENPASSSEPADALFLIGDTMVSDILSMVRQRLPAARLQVFSLAVALSYAASEGDVPESYVGEALKAAKRIAKKPDAKTN